MEDWNSGSAQASSHAACSSSRATTRVSGTYRPPKGPNRPGDVEVVVKVWSVRRFLFWVDCACESRPGEMGRKGRRRCRRSQGWPGGTRWPQSRRMPPRTPAHPRTRHAHTHGSTRSSRHVTWSLSFPSLPCSQPRPLLVRLRLDKFQSLCQRVTLLSSRQIPKPKSPMRDWPGSGLEGRGRDFDRAPARAGGTVLRDWVASARFA